MKMLSSIIAISIIALIGCKKNNVSFNTSTFDFPNSVGNKYVYTVTDSTTNKKYALNVTITGNATIAGKPVKIWTYVSSPSSIIDTNYVFSDKDSVVFYNARKQKKFIYHLPLVVNAYWYGGYVGDNLRVVSNGSLIVNNKNYDNTFLITEIAHSPNYSLNRNFWVVPNIGIIRMNYFLNNLGAIENQSWELTDYQITNN